MIALKIDIYILIDKLIFKKILFLTFVLILLLSSINGLELILSNASEFKEEKLLEFSTVWLSNFLLLFFFKDSQLDVLCET